MLPENTAQGAEREAFNISAQIATLMNHNNGKISTKREVNGTDGWWLPIAA